MPAAWMNPEHSLDVPKIGLPSGVMGYKPLQVRLTRMFFNLGMSWIIRLEAWGRNWLVSQVLNPQMFGDGVMQKKI